MPIISRSGQEKECSHLSQLRDFSFKGRRKRTLPFQATRWKEKALWCCGVSIMFSPPSCQGWKDWNVLWMKLPKGLTCINNISILEDIWGRLRISFSQTLRLTSANCSDFYLAQSKRLFLIIPEMEEGWKTEVGEGRHRQHVAVSAACLKIGQLPLEGAIILHRGSLSFPPLATCAGLYTFAS